MTDSIADAAKIVHEAMVHAVREFKGEPQPWQNGNSFAEAYARRAACDILDLTPNASVPAELVERVARALCAARGENPAGEQVRFVDGAAHSVSFLDIARHDARAAIAAIPPAGRVEELEQRLRALHEALTPSAETKAAYIGEFSFTIEEGEYGSRIILVPWTTIKEIMAAIIGRAALSGEGR